MAAAGTWYDRRGRSRSTTGPAWTSDRGRVRTADVAHATRGRSGTLMISRYYAMDGCTVSARGLHETPDCAAELDRPDATRAELRTETLVEPGGGSSSGSPGVMAYLRGATPHFYPIVRV